MLIHRKQQQQKNSGVWNQWHSACNEVLPWSRASELCFMAFTAALLSCVLLKVPGILWQEGLGLGVAGQDWTGQAAVGGCSCPGKPGASVCGGSESCGEKAEGKSSNRKRGAAEWNKKSDSLLQYLNEVFDAASHCLHVTEAVSLDGMVKTRTRDGTELYNLPFSE